MDKDREITLVRDCQKGNRRALDELVRTFERPVYNAAFRMLGNRDDAADVTQTTFLRLIENIDRFNPSFRLFSWVYRITVNEAIDQLKLRKRRKPLTETGGDDTSEGSAATTLLCKQVQAALMELDDGHRTVMVLRYFSECSYGQIGEILEIPEKTVKSRLFSARRQLKGILSTHGMADE